MAGSVAHRSRWRSPISIPRTALKQEAPTHPGVPQGPQAPQHSGYIDALRQGMGSGIAAAGATAHALDALIHDVRRIIAEKRKPVIPSVMPRI